MLKDQIPAVQSLVHEVRAVSGWWDAMIEVLRHLSSSSGKLAPAFGCAGTKLTADLKVLRKLRICSLRKASSLQ